MTTERPKQQRQQAHLQWKEAVAGALSGAITVLLLHPLDVVKTRLQVQEASTHRYRGTVHAIKVITKREGPRGLYAGLTPSIVGNAVSWGMYWLTWKAINSWWLTQQDTPELSWSMKLLVGMQAGVLVTVATNPVWVVKTRMQLDSTNVHPRTGAPRPRGAAGGFLPAVRTIARNEGMRGFSRGLGPALLLCSHGAVQMMAYEELKSLRRRSLADRGLQHMPQLDALITGTAAKLLASGCTYPLQVVRSRMQQQLRGSKVMAYKTLPRAVMSVMQRDGVRGLYSGFTANALRVCPQAGLQFFLYESARRLLGP